MEYLNNKSTMIFTDILNRKYFKYVNDNINNGNNNIKSGYYGMNNNQSFRDYSHANRIAQIHF